MKSELADFQALAPPAATLCRRPMPLCPCPRPSARHRRPLPSAPPAAPPAAPPDCTTRGFRRTAHFAPPPHTLQPPRHPPLPNLLQGLCLTETRRKSTAIHTRRTSMAQSNGAGPGLVIDQALLLGAVVR